MLKSYYISGCSFVNETFSGLLKSIETSPDPKMAEALDFVDLSLSPREIKLFAYFACFALYVLSMLAALFALLAALASTHSTSCCWGLLRRL